jgi:hypothetical protein
VQDPALPTLDELIFGVGRFASVLRPDPSYAVFVASTAKPPDLSLPAHRTALHRWLNAWGCRIGYPQVGERMLFDESVAEWWESWHARLPPARTRLVNLSDRRIGDLAAAYADLSGRPVAPAGKPGSLRTLAPTATAKALWVLRPLAVTAWDNRIALRLHGARDESAFAAHLRLARSAARSLVREAGGERQLLDAVGRRGSSVAKILDEYWYITLSYRQH